MQRTPIRRALKPPSWQRDYVTMSGESGTGAKTSYRDDSTPVTRLSLRQASPTNSREAAAGHQRTAAGGHQLPHRLNHKRQLDKLVREATIYTSCSFIVQPKDSGKQVLMTFSPPGYFLAVAVPAFQAFTAGHQVTTLGHVIKCLSVTPFYAGSDV